LRNPDLHGFAPDKCPVALLLIDVINDLEFEDAPLLYEHAVPMARNLAELRRRAGEAGIPVVYVNDNFGLWKSDFRSQVDHCLEDGVRGEPIARLLAPSPDDYFVLKPKHSGFYSTALELLLRYLGSQRLILTGMAGNLCVLYTANDAYMRDFELCVPADCIASNTRELNEQSLKHMERFLKADTRPSTELDLARLARAPRD